MAEADPSLHDSNKNNPDSDLMPLNTLTSTNAPLDPFNRLPTELLANIFFCVVESPLHYSRTESHNWEYRTRFESPRLLSSVCNRWRSIASSNSRLWVNIHVKFKGPMEDGYERTLLKQWLERSGQNLISLKIGPLYECVEGRSRSPPPTALQNSLEDVTGIVLSVLHRCKAIYIGSGVLDLERIQNHFENGMPSFQELCIRWGFDECIDLR